MHGSRNGVNNQISRYNGQKWLVIVTKVVGDSRREESHLPELPAAASCSSRVALCEAASPILSLLFVGKEQVPFDEVV